ncbi:DUF2513 domain-containing protein [Periweissella fabaria]|uniref:DUF2513 domain-containing protein n=1 Tax=Periweissella fabaria TaxID=546157 RepID=A0ABN8BI89_9LACO|nr:DUF2513 domain-containing protein [Periweissella fabaria]MCM0597354.1 DUF2513 domain-containing protein [Periweissella fabaria]CAH0416141.1 hypothetical protein WFA24289_00440 [Periweissella fabaria]
MQLNHEYVRVILLFIESNHKEGHELTMSDFFSSKSLEKIDKEEIIYTLKKLNEADYIDIKFFYGSNVVIHFGCSGITWKGHEFLDNIRDNKVWDKTKNIAKNVSSVSLSVLSDIASKVITDLISKQIGI